MADFGFAKFCLIPKRQDTDRVFYRHNDVTIYPLHYDDDRFLRLFQEELQSDSEEIFDCCKLTYTNGEEITLNRSMLAEKHLGEYRLRYSPFGWALEVGRFQFVVPEDAKWTKKEIYECENILINNSVDYTEKILQQEDIVETFSWQKNEKRVDCLDGIILSGELEYHIGENAYKVQLEMDVNWRDINDSIRKDDSDHGIYMCGIKIGSYEKNGDEVTLRIGIKS